MAILPGKKAFPKRPIDYDAIWACGEMSPRLQKLRKEWEDAPAYIVSDDAVSFTRGYMAADGLPIPLRLAYAMKEILANCKLLLRDGELIVGQMNGYIRGIDIITADCPEAVLNNIERGAFDRKMSETSTAICSPEDMAALKKDAEFWVKKVPTDVVNAALYHELGEDHKELYMEGSMILEGILFREHPEMSIWGRAMPSETLGRGRSTYRFEPAKIGLKKVKELVQAELDRIEKEGAYMTDLAHSITPWRRKAMLEAMIITCDAIIHWAHRYADLAEQQAKECKDPVRKQELERIASNCRWVPENPPRDYWEALQASRFMLVASLKEKPMRKESVLNRMDLDMYPYYIKDKDEGKITPAFAVELFECYLMKNREHEAFDPELASMRHSQGTQLPNITIGGLDHEGNDCTNEMSCIILRAVATMKFSEPTIYIRVHDKMDDDFLKMAVKTNMEHRGGTPAYLNDKEGSEKFMEYGVPKDLCCDWQTSGCLGYHLNCSEHIGGFMNINLIKIFELTLNDGFDPQRNKQIGIHTGKFEDMKTLEDVKEAFYKQLDHFAYILNRDYEIRHSLEISNPNQSAMNCIMYYDSAIEYACNPLVGGCPPELNCLASMWVGERGSTDVADCLSGLKKVIFEDKLCTKEELLKALHANWEGYEELHQACLNAPKYGNDDPYVDDLFEEVTQKIRDILRARPDPITGTKVVLFKGAASAHLYYGRQLGALPNGRILGEPCNDGGVSARAGCDVCGPTALLNSAAKFDNLPYMGSVINVKLNRTMLNTGDKVEKVVSMIRAYIDKGGWHLQINIHDQEELIDARKNPDKHRNLLVRVGGYSANFVDLPYALQEEIIQRTNHAI